MKTVVGRFASETGFYNGAPMIIEAEPLSHKDAILESLATELTCKRTKSVQNAIDSAVLWLESPHDQ